MGRIYFRNVAEIFDPSFPDTEHPNWAVHVDLWVFCLRLVVIFGKGFGCGDLRSQQQFYM